MSLDLRAIMRTEPKELARMCSDAYHEGVKDALKAIQQRMETFPLSILETVSQDLSERAFRAVQDRRNEWIDGLDHSLSESKTYISMPIERYQQLKALEVLLSEPK